MKVKFFNTMEMKNITEYETNEIIGLGEDISDEEKKDIHNGAMPMLNFITKEGRNIAVPIQLLISIKD